MKILPVNNYPYQKRQPVFGNSSRLVLGKSNQLLYKTNTWLFRPDFNWRYFAEFLEHKYANTNKVTIIDHACSSGEEAFSIAMSLIDGIGEKAKKYFPIIAKDYDEENITIAKNYKIPVDYAEKLNLAIHMSDVSKYGNFVGYDFIPNDILKKNIQFSKGNILNDIDALPQNNTVLFCRNFWPYLNSEDRESLMSRLASKFDKTCYIAVGDFDITNSNISYLFKKYGFAEANFMNVFGKEK